MKRKWPVYLLFITVALDAGALSGWLIADSVQAYEQMPHPPGSPPAGAFPWVWSFLYLLMGVSAARIWLSPQPGSRSALLLWGLQLAVNFAWPLLFFDLQMVWLAFFWLLLLWLLVFSMIRAFSAVDSWAAKLQLPYLLWLSYAAYLNLAQGLLSNRLI